MNDELLVKASNLFDTAEKWNAFCELMNANGQIQDRWWKQLQTEVYNREIKNHDSDWEIYIDRQWDIWWGPKGDDPNGLLIHFWADAFRVTYEYGGIDTNKVNRFLNKNPEYVTAIRNCFDRIEGIDSPSIAWERWNFSFDTIYDGHFPDRKTLSWYAGNETKKFADQLIAKVRKFQTSEITAMFRDINSKCKA